MSQFLSAAGLFAAGTLFGICLCLAERSLRRRLKAACRPTRGRALLSSSSFVDRAPTSAKSRPEEPSQGETPPKTPWPGQVASLAYSVHRH